jgi:DNA repair exonuclease SbcCD ATPase subunit
MNIQSIRNQLERQKGSRNQISKDLKKSQETISLLEQEISYSESAQAIISAVAKITQNELRYRIEEPVSLAISSVFDDPYKMVADFQTTLRGTTECNLGFERNGNIVDPLSSSGGGVVDIASFSLRIGAWSLGQPRSRAVILLDEPFRFVSRNKMALAGTMLKETSKQLGLQIILITHIEDLVAVADKIFEVSIHNGVSEVEEIKT